MHKEILQPAGSLLTDHVNRDKLDNRRLNLRPATSIENQYNRGKQVNNTTGHKGIYWHKGSDKWFVSISIKGKLTAIGYFTKIEEAIKAHTRFAKKHHGEFALTNLSTKGL